jgi:hypothetical protein
MQEEILKRFDSFVDKMGEISSEYGPVATEATVSALYYDAALIVGFGVLFFVISATFVVASVSFGLRFLNLLTLSVRHFDDTDDRAHAQAGKEASKIFSLFMACICGLLGFTFFLTSLTHLFNRQAWVTLLDPQAGVAYRILGL